MKNVTLIVLLSLGILVAACESKNATPAPPEEKKHEHPHEEKGPHGGMMLESEGGEIHVEFVHDEEAGMLSLYPSQKLAQAPVINLQTEEGPKQIATNMVEGEEAHYQAKDEALMGHLHGRIALDFQGKTYNLDIPHEHQENGEEQEEEDMDHEHDDHEHDDHEHMDGEEHDHEH